MTEEVRRNLANMLKAHDPLSTGRYLGLTSLVGRDNKEIFSYIKDRLWKKLKGLRVRKLSKAGREVLIKATAQSSPTFCMSTFLLPITLLDDLHRMMNSFW